MLKRLQKLLPILLLLTACATHENGWTPTIDTAPAKRRSPRKTKTRLVTDDGIEINGTVFRRTYINCMKKRRHPVID